MTGTYRLNTARSDNASAAVYGATNSLPEADQLLILGGLMSRLESPGVLVIEQRGSAVTITTPNAPRSSNYASPEGKMAASHW